MPLRQIPYQREAQSQAPRRRVELGEEMKPSFRNLFMNPLIRGRVVPTISARISWLIFGMTGSVFPSLPKRASSKRTRARRFSLELKS